MLIIVGKWPQSQAASSQQYFILYYIIYSIFKPNPNLNPNPKPNPKPNLNPKPNPNPNLMFEIWHFFRHPFDARNVNISISKLSRDGGRFAEGL